MPTPTLEDQLVVVNMESDEQEMIGTYEGSVEDTVNYRRLDGTLFNAPNDCVEVMPLGTYMVRKDEAALVAGRELLSAEKRITLALGNMPYLPMSSFYSTSADPDSLARTLESFAVALARIAEVNKIEHDELVQLRNDVSAVQRLFAAVV